MKKLISMLLSAVMLLTVLSGCGGGGEEKTGSENNIDSSVAEDTGVRDEAADYDVKGTVSVGINSYRNSDFEMLFNTFKSLYPNVTVEPIVFESSTDDATAYLTSQAMAGRPLPDIIFDDAGSLPTYIQNGWVYPLSSFIEGDSDFEKIPKNITDPFTYGGRLYALPQTMHSNMLLVNTDLVEELNVDLPEYDWNWDDFTAFIKACTNSEYSGVEDLSDQYNWGPGAMSDDCTIIGYNYESESYDLTTVQTYVNYVLDIKKINGVEATSLKQNASSGVSDYEKKFGVAPGTDAAFIAGKVAGTLTGTWRYAYWMQQDLPFNWEMYPIPQSSPGRIPLHVDYCWMTTNVTEDNADAAWEFLRFVTYSKTGNLARLSSYDEDHITSDMYNTYYIPCTTDEDVMEKFESLPYVTETVLYLSDNFSNGYLGDPEKSVPGFESVEYSIIGKPAYESINGMYDFSSRMADAQSRANAEIKEYKKNFETALAKFESEFTGRK